MIGLVSQEPVLFNGSIRDNILYGTPDITVSQSDIERVCRQANVLEFAMKMADGLDTNVTIILGNYGRFTKKWRKVGEKKIPQKEIR